MFCSKCGNMMPDGTRFCPSCGTPQNPAPQYPVYKNPGTANGNTAKSVENRSASSVSFVQAIRLFFANYATFSGRSRRSEYWYAYLFVCIVTTILNLINIEFLSAIFDLAIAIPSLSIMFRRLHDVGKSGALLLLVLIPTIAIGLRIYRNIGQDDPDLLWLLLLLLPWVFLLILLCKDSQPGDNQYGPDPKHRC